MAWNGSSAKPEQKNDSVRPRTGSSSSSSLKHGVIAGILVVIGGVLAVLWMSNRSPDPVSGEDHAGVKSVITEVKPEVVVPRVAETNDPHKGMVKFKGKFYPEYNSKGGKIFIVGDQVRYHTPQIYTNRLAKSSTNKLNEHFDSKVDVELAMVISAPLGSTRIGPQNPYDENFTKRFIESLKTPIIIKETDSDSVKELKRAVIETKLELKARYDDGEDIAKILNDNAHQMRELSVYKSDIDRLVLKESRNASPKDLATIVEAANKMLAERGISPLRLPMILQRKLSLHTTKE